MWVDFIIIIIITIIIVNIIIIIIIIIIIWNGRKMQAIETIIDYAIE